MEQRPPPPKGAAEPQPPSPALEEAMRAMGRSPLFRSLDARQLQEVAAVSTPRLFAPGQTLVRAEEPSEDFYLILQGEAVVTASDARQAEPIQISRLGPSDSVGEMGVLLEQPRTATVVAIGTVRALRWDRRAFNTMFDRVPGFGRAIAQALAHRLHRASRRLLVPELATERTRVDANVVRLLPVEFIERHRVLPVSSKDNEITLGILDDPDPSIVNLIRQFLPSAELRFVSIDHNFFKETLRSLCGVDLSPPLESIPIDGPESVAPPPKGAVLGGLDSLLRRMVAEGASDMHLSAGQKPRWRVDGEVRALEDAAVLGPTDVQTLLAPAMDDRIRKEFETNLDADFAHAVPRVARFRVNLFRNMNGISAVVRQIPAKVLSIEQLGLPATLAKLCEHSKGLLLVTGPTGSGKSTTLAAMVNHINQTRKGHILTLEDPVEFVHESQLALVNQRELGAHARTFARALRAALREDPDVILVGEMRDFETVSLVLEAANTGHLVLGTLHTSTAVSTIDRIIDLFPSDQQNQIRTTLADVLRGVVCQILVKCVGGGRAAALEVLVGSPAVANLIRSGKGGQIFSAMQTGRAQGNMLLNESLVRLVLSGRVERAEALAKSVDKGELAVRLDSAGTGPRVDAADLVTG